MTNSLRRQNMPDAGALLEAVRTLRAAEPSLAVEPLVARLREQRPDLETGAERVGEALRALEAEESEATAAAAPTPAMPKRTSLPPRPLNEAWMDAARQALVLDPMLAEMPDESEGEWCTAVRRALQRDDIEELARLQACGDAASWKLLLHNALHLACATDDVQMLHNALQWACHKDDVEVLQLCLERGASVNAADAEGHSPLWRSVVEASCLTPFHSPPLSPPALSPPLSPSPPPAPQRKPPNPPAGPRGMRQTAHRGEGVIGRTGAHVLCHHAPSSRSSVAQRQRFTRPNARQISPASHHCGSDGKACCGADAAGRRSAARQDNRSGQRG